MNSHALKIAGIRQETEDPPNGTFGRDQQVRLTGILYENAVSLVEKIIPAPSVEMVASSIQAAQEDLWKKGLTGVHDFDRQRCFSALQLLHGRGLLLLRVLKVFLSKILSRLSKSGCAVDLEMISCELEE